MWDTTTNSYTAAPQNPDSVYDNSRSNTGVKRLPHAIPSILPESKAGSENNAAYNFGTSTTSTAATTGPIVRYNGPLASTMKLPPHLDGKWIIAESAKNWVKVATVNSAGTAVTAVDSFPGSTTVIKSTAPSGGYGIIDMKVGPNDGALYIAHYSAQNFNSAATTRISRIEYTGTCLPASSVSVMPAGEKERLARGVLYSNINGRLVWPDGMRVAEIFDLQGKKVWSHERNMATEAATQLPAGLKAGVLQVRFRP